MDQSNKKDSKYDILKKHSYAEIQKMLARPTRRVVEFISPEYDRQGIVSPRSCRGILSPEAIGLAISRRLWSQAFGQGILGPEASRGIIYQFKVFDEKKETRHLKEEQH